MFASLVGDLQNAIGLQCCMHDCDHALDADLKTFDSQKGRPTRQQSTRCVSFLLSDDLCLCVLSDDLFVGGRYTLAILVISL